MSTGAWHWCLERGGLPEDCCIQTSQAQCLELLSVYQCYTYFHYLCKHFKRAWRIVMPSKTLLCAWWASATLPFISHSPVLHAVTLLSLAGVSLSAGQTRCLPYDRLPLSCERPAPAVSAKTSCSHHSILIFSLTIKARGEHIYLHPKQKWNSLCITEFILLYFLIISKVSI